MLLALTLWMIREYKLAGNRKEFLKRINHRFSFKGIGKVGVLLAIHFFPLAIEAQDQKLSYQVIRNGDVIGHMSFQQLKQGCSTHLWVESEVKARFILLLIILAKEETIYSNGILVFSSINRKLNGKEKANIQMKLDGNTYRVNNKGSIEQFNTYPIRFNLLSMYGTEPTQINRAYADNYSEFVPVVKTGANRYKVTLPDGNYNNYFYQDGICTRVEVHNSMYSLQLVLIGKS